MTMTELNPCPFCGSDNVQVEISNLPEIFHRKNSWVHCNQCNTDGPFIGRPESFDFDDVKKLAVEAWNTRPE